MKAGARTLVLTAIVVGLAGYIGLVERGRQTTDEARATRVQLLPTFDRAQALGIEIDAGGARGKVRPAHPAELLDTLAIAEIDREATVGAKAAGLDPPAARVAISMAGQGGARELTLDVGAVDASGRGVYVRRGGDGRVLVTGAHLRDLVERELAAKKDAGPSMPAAVPEPSSSPLPSP